MHLNIGNLILIEYDNSRHPEEKENLSPENASSVLLIPPSKGK